jgi:riboflavin biosynthesis pyrimidine reductase
MNAAADRPRVVVAATMSVDGRMALHRNRPLLDPEASRQWRGLRPESAPALDERRRTYLHERYAPQAVLEGSGTFVAATAEAPDWSGAKAGSGALYTDFLPREVVERPDRDRWFAVVDGRGRVRWSITSMGGTDLLVLAAESTPSGYLAFLRDERIPYLVVGGARVDLPTALRRMRERLNVTCVLSEAGGGLNGALLRAGLVDELQILVFPAVIGGLGVPSLFDGPELAAGESPERLRLLSAEVEDDGMIWLGYEVDREARTEPR